MHNAPYLHIPISFYTSSLRRPLIGGTAYTYTSSLRRSPSCSTLYTYTSSLRRSLIGGTSYTYTSSLRRPLIETTSYTYTSSLRWPLSSSILYTYTSSLRPSIISLPSSHARRKIPKKRAVTSLQFIFLKNISQNTVLCYIAYSIGKI